MKRISAFRAAFLIVAAVVVVVHAAPAAAFDRYIRATGTSTGPGTCSITIESFGLLGRSGPRPESVTSFNVNVSIPTASSPANSALLIRNDLAAALPGDYTVTNPIGHPELVKIFRSTGTFTLSITEDVAGQTIEEADIYLPALGLPGMLLLGALLLMAGAILIRRRSGTS